VLIEREKNLLTKMERLIKSHNTKLVSPSKQSWRDEARVPEIEPIKTNPLDKNQPSGKHEDKVLAFFSANPSKEFIASEIAYTFKMLYNNNMYKVLNNLYRKGLIERIVNQQTGRILWRYKN
jgi:hypothetical protein